MKKFYVLITREKEIIKIPFNTDDEAIQYTLYFRKRHKQVNIKAYTPDDEELI